MFLVELNSYSSNLTIVVQCTPLHLVVGFQLIRHRANGLYSPVDPFMYFP